MMKKPNIKHPVQEGHMSNPIHAAQPPPGYYYVPQPVPYPVQTPKTNGLAIASLVLGILWLYWVGAILALVFGYTAKRQIAESGGTQQGRGLATAGIVLGWIGVGTFSVFVLVILIASVGGG